VAACDLILEYTLSAAAVAKGFTAYFAALIGADISKLRFQVSCNGKGGYTCMC
jgi:APA family basic amino acid/polyamine antiporter